MGYASRMLFREAKWFVATIVVVGLGVLVAGCAGGDEYPRAGKSARAAFKNGCQRALEPIPLDARMSGKAAHSVWDISGVSPDGRCVAVATSNNDCESPGPITVEESDAVVTLTVYSRYWGRPPNNICLAYLGTPAIVPVKLKGPLRNRRIRDGCKLQKQSAKGRVDPPCREYLSRTVCRSPKRCRLATWLRASNGD